MDVVSYAINIVTFLIPWGICPLYATTSNNYALKPMKWFAVFRCEGDIELLIV